MGLSTRADTVEQCFLFDVGVLGPGIIGAKRPALKLLGIDLLETLLHFIARVLRAIDISLDSLANNSDLLLGLVRVNCSRGAKRFHLRVVFAEPGIKK